MKKTILLSLSAFLLLALFWLGPLTPADASIPTAHLAPQSPATSGGAWEPVWRGSGGLRDMACATNLLCVAVGDQGLILITRDGGDHWSQTLLDNAPDLLGIAIQDQLMVAVGAQGTIARSLDQGRTWTVTTAPTSLTLTDVAWNGAEGWAVGEQGTILHSTDGGQTWTSQTSNTTQTLHAVQFVDATTGYAAGEKATLLKTTDGGQTWTPLTSNFPAWARIRAITFTDAQHGLIAGEAGHIRLTQDGGQTWETITTDVQVEIFAIHQHGDLAVLGGANGTIATSPDGRTWTVRTSSQNDRDVMAVATQGAHFTLAAGILQDAQRTSFFAYRSLDGETFQRVVGGYALNPRTLRFHTLYEAALPSRDIQYVVGDDGAIGKSTDGGDTWAWTRLETGREGYPVIHGISCPTVQDCWIGGWVQGEQGFVFVTHDGGATWTRQITPGFTRPVYDVEMVDLQYGHVAGNPEMFYTTDGGQTWKPSSVEGNTANVEIAMASRYEGWTAQRNLGHRYTTSAGKIWLRFMPYDLQPRHYFFGVDTLDVNQDGQLDEGWLVGCIGPLVDDPAAEDECPPESGVIFHAQGNTDPGEAQPLPPGTPQLNAIAMIDAQRGWVGGAHGVMLTTDTGGATWRAIDSPVQDLINGITFYKDQIGLTVTRSGDILRYRKPGRGLVSYTQSTPITIDGEISDWHQGGAMVLNPDNASTILGEPPYPTSDQLSGQFFGRWTADTLYLMAQIQDAALQPDHSVTLVLDGRNDDRWNPGHDDDLGITLAANGDFDAGSPEANATIAHAIRTTPTGWQWEMAIPASLLGHTALDETVTMGINLALAGKQDGRAYQLLLSGRSLTASPAVWGDLRLMGDTMILQNGLVDYEGAADTHLTIWGEDGKTPHGSDPILEIIYTSGRPYSNGLIRFALPQVLTQATIHEAQLRLYIPSAVVRNDFQVGAYRLLRPWNPDTATWYQADADTRWGQGGALEPQVDYDPQPLDVVTIPADPRHQWLSWDVSEAVAYWQQHPDENFGIILMGTNESQKLRAYSSDFNEDTTLRPQLLTTFSLNPRPTPTPTPTPPIRFLYLPILRK